MPTYSYACRKCGHIQDVFHAISANPRIKCEKCGGSSRRLLGTGAGIIFKGSGFYETDYKRNGSKAASKSESKTESKSDSKKDGGTSEKKSESKGSKKTESAVA